MQRRDFITRLGTVAATGLFAGWATSAEETCTPITPYVSRCQVGIPSNMIHVAALQQSSEWCWAACIEMVFTYYGHRVPQARIVRETWGAVVNMPGQPEQILADLNREWKDEKGKKFTVTGDALSANAANAVEDLRQDRPLILGTLGHAVVLTALTTDVNQGTRAWQVVAATVRDPWPGRGKRILTPQEWYNINFAARISVEDSDEE
ncbi:MAG TPA: papain-like cysteine protease family protein [Candidatus Angelobacter sp.]|nr:papain-like cysteine protease family protein [Candidatus Angelobacter sp.]